MQVRSLPALFGVPVKPPFCNYRIDEGVRVLDNGRTVADPLALAEPCHCMSGHFKDFAAQLARFNHHLKLGFDCGNRCYVIWRDLPRIETINAGDGITFRAVTRKPLVIKPLQWLVMRKVNGGNKFFHFPRDPGDWVFRELWQYAPQQFELDGSWVGPTVDRMGREAETARKQKAKQFSNDVWNEVMSVADRGNPLNIRTGVLVDKKTA